MIRLGSLLSLCHRLVQFGHIVQFHWAVQQAITALIVSLELPKQKVVSSSNCIVPVALKVLHGLMSVHIVLLQLAYHLVVDLHLVTPHYRPLAVQRAICHQVVPLGSAYLLDSVPLLAIGIQNASQELLRFLRQDFRNLVDAV